MKLAIISGGTGWHIQDLLRAAKSLDISADVLDFRKLWHVAAGSGASPLLQYDLVQVRTMPAGSLEQIVFRMNVLGAAEGEGVLVFNSSQALEVCVDKFHTSNIFAFHKIKTPQTIACQTWQDAMTAFDELGRDVVVKPLFGSEGRGIVRVTDQDLAWRTFRAIEQTGGVLYLQKFIRHPGWDIRIFMHRGGLLGAMKRHSTTDYRTNVAQGGRAEAYQPSDSELSLAMKAVRVTGCMTAGVDLIQDEAGELYVLEVNAVPGWKALSSVCNVDVASEILRNMKEAWYDHL